MPCQFVYIISDIRVKRGEGMIHFKYGRFPIQATVFNQDGRWVFKPMQNGSEWFWICCGHRPFLGSELDTSSVTLQNVVSLVSPSPAGLCDDEGLVRSLTGFQGKHDVYRR